MITFDASPFFLKSPPESNIVVQLMMDVSPLQPESDLLVVTHKSDDVGIDEIEQMSALCRQNNMVTPNYASTPAKWNFLFRESPAGSSWVSMIVEQKSGRVHGFCGLAAFWARCGRESFRGATVSNIVINPAIRNRRLPFRGKQSFSTLSLMDACFSKAIQKDFGLLVAHSRIPATIWGLLEFEKVDVRVFEMIHSSLAALIWHYWKCFRSQGGKRKLLAAPHAIVVGLASWCDRWRRVRKLNRTLKADIDVRLEEVTVFDERLASLIGDFLIENPSLMTCARDVESLNWRFKNAPFRKFVFSVGENPVGACVIQENVAGSNANFPEVIDFILLESSFRHSSRIFELLRKRFKYGYKWNLYVSSGFSERLFAHAFSFGYRAVAGAGSLWRETKKGIGELGVIDQFYFKTSDSAFQNTPFERKSETKMEWYYTPLFFAPRYHAPTV